MLPRFRWLGLCVFLFACLTLAGGKGEAQQAGSFKTKPSGEDSSLPRSLRETRKFHRQITVVDWHVDSVFQLTRRWYDFRKHQRKHDLDFSKMKRGGIGAQVFSLWVPPRAMKTKGGGWWYLKRMYRNYRRLLKLSNGLLVHARNADDIRRIRKQGKIAALLGVEGAHPLEGKLARMRVLARWGVAYLGLTWNNSNPFATSAKDEWYTKGFRRRGLTAKGRKLVRLCEKYKILVDLSHSGRRTFWDVAKMSRRPFIASHSNAYRLRPHYRNLSDKQMRAIAKSGGIIGVNFYALFLRKYKYRFRTQIKHVIKHIKYMMKVAGPQTIALGSDFDGIVYKPRKLRHIGHLPRLTLALVKAGFTPQQVRQILGENSLRVLGAK
ncbi:MAG: membrane dipeptidase [Deltaproteobacteria bacterium]|nr:MAG: membrane dipeptidase [Deltaproteobacteria bacterium]